ncbi:MAG: transglycosylase domain-containing protein [Erysipelotrichaceae bacterium]|nr:transglycosylase domain-containing protein [Erysipelotrichaceae bacterium]
MKKKSNTKQTLKRQRIRTIKIVIMAVIVAMSSVCIYLGYGIFNQVSGFSSDASLNTESSVQVDSEGNEYYSYSSSGVKKDIEYNDIPQVMIDAVVAAEDSRFYEHNGFDVPRILKALVGNIASGGITAGGSTITQQLIKKTYYPNEEQTIERKVGELVLSIEATSQTTKEEIITAYLNNVYYGYGNKAIGLYAASYYYFNKAPQNLTLPEAALLAGCINSPTNYDPFNNLELAQQRRDIVLDLMEYHGYISEQECEDAKSIPVENTLNSNPITNNSEYQAYADKVTREVYEKTGYDPNTTSMIITTYIDTDLQSYLNDIATGESYDYPDEYMQTGASVQETTTGRIVGVLAARDYVAMGTSYAYAASKELAANDESYNYGQRNQPGSSLKPIIAYAAAFEYLDYSTAHYVHDVPYSDGTWTPSNWDNSYHGDVTIKEALVQSWNLAAIQTLSEVVSEVGSDEIFSYLEGFGFDTYGEEFSLGYAIGSWKTGVTPEEEAAAYAAIANGGTYIEPHTVESITLIDTGEVIYIDEEAQENSTQALSEESAFMIRSIMTDYVSDGSGKYSYLNLGYQIGAKSGTTNHDTSTSNSDLVGKSKDIWMAAFSPDYSWSVWCGYTSEAQKLGYYPTGSDAAIISGMIAKYLHSDGVKNSYPSQPSGVVSSTCISGIYPYISPTSSTPSSRIISGYFKSSNLPSDTATGASIDILSSFTAMLSGSSISVTFSEYPSSTSSSLTKTYTVNGKSYTLPYYGDITQIYGNIVYQVDVTDASGNSVYSQSLSSNTGTLNYTFSAGEYTVTGYYTYESGSGSSNKISQTITVGSTGTASYSRSNVTATSVTYSVTVPSGSSVSITVNGDSKTLTSSSSVTFSGLSPSTSYNATFIETTSSNTTNTLTSDSFTTSSSTTDELEDENSVEDNDTSENEDIQINEELDE